MSRKGLNYAVLLLVLTSIFMLHSASYAGFTDIGAGLTGCERCALAWGDYDADGDLDLVISGTNRDVYPYDQTITKIYRNDNGSFVDSGIQLPGLDSAQLAWGDYDNDGDLDLILSGYLKYAWSSGQTAIYRNDNGTFRDINAGIPFVSSGVAWGDYDNDGDLDIACSSRIYRNDKGTFNDIGASITGCSLAWGDYDNDGDLDLAAANSTASGIFLNNNGVFSDSGMALPAIIKGSLAWGDFDNDGDLDLVLAGTTPIIGSTGYVAVTKIYRNTGSSFVEIETNIPEYHGATLAWGDYDNDGDIDLVIASNGGNIYRNDGISFSDSGIGLPSAIDGSLAFGDYDNDGDLDIAIAGDNYPDTARIYRNDSATVNTPPTAPSNLATTTNGNRTAFSWNTSSDVQTPAAGLSYNMRIGTTPGNCNIFSGMADVSTGQRIIPALGNAQKRPSWSIGNLPRGTYYWSVQAVDASYAASEWVAEQTVTLTTPVKVCGHVRAPGGEGLAGVCLSTSDSSGATLTDVSGYYELWIMPGWSGTITPVKADCRFSPSSLSYTNVTSDQNDQNYTGYAFTNIEAALIGVSSPSIVWGDYDNDGDMDLAVAGNTYSSGSICKVYRNDSGIFTDTNAALTGVILSSLAWGDYDNDSDLDLALAGYTNDHTRISKIYRNDSGAFTDIVAGLTGIQEGSLAWGDYDNDGDLDLAVTGSTSSGTRISKVYRNDKGSFTDTGAALTGLAYSAVAWGDYDNDGDLDLALSGSTGTVYCSKIYRNDSGVFTDTGAAITGVIQSSLAWGDYDNDGDLDLALSGTTSVSPYYTFITRIYRNDGGVFADIDAGLTGSYNGSLAWGDYDNDGDLDLAVAGNTGSSVGFSKIFHNDAGIFTDSAINLPGVTSGKLAWADYDGDGDLDIALAGYASNDAITRIYRNDEEINTNTIPATPTSLTANINGNSITLSWNAASDAQTPVSGLNYNIRVGTAPGKDDVFTGMANAATGFRRIPAAGNAQKRLSWTVKGCKPAADYYWSVQAIDTAFAGSEWAQEQTTPVNARKISGTVQTSAGLALSGVRVTTDDQSSFTTTDSTGYYELWVMSGWSGSIIPSKTGSMFAPAEISYSNVTSDQSGQDFTGSTLIDIGAGTTAFSSGSQAWGDYDNDGDLDLAVAGSTSTGRISRIYRNENGTFTDIGAGFIGVSNSSVAWCDYDNDGDLDMVVAGYTGTSRITNLYRNDNGVFVFTETPFEGVSGGALAWGDYDNDGDLDLALSGYEAISNASISRIYRNNKGSFTDIGAGLVGLSSGYLAWGDYDNDGDLDLIIAGYTGTAYMTKLYRNDNEVFVDTGTSLPAVRQCSIAWGDYDSDGDLDLAITGSTPTATYISRVYRNDNGTFTDINAALTGVTWASLAWGDYDNDGDLDLALAGMYQMPYFCIGKIYRNDAGSFVDSQISLPALFTGSLAWGDYDADGDLDLTISGQTGTLQYVSGIYRNDSLVPNTAPTAPSGLSSTVDSATATFSWSAATDAQTPAPGLCYNLRVGTAPGKDDIFSGMANALTGLRRLPATGNAQKRLTWTLKDLPAGTLYWSVQAIDTAYAGSAWATEQQAVVPDTTAPVITSVAVSPNMAAAGDAVHITVDATDNLAVTSVTADGTALTKTVTTWEGDISASATLGAHTITVSAADAAGNTATDTSASYKTARVVGSSIAGATLPVMSTAKDNFLFRFWGKVQIIDTTSFWLDDGSPFRIKVIAPGYAGIEDDDYITTRGILDPGDPPAITCPAGTVMKLK